MERKSAEARFRCVNFRASGPEEYWGAQADARRGVGHWHVSEYEFRNPHNHLNRGTADSLAHRHSTPEHAQGKAERQALQFLKVWGGLSLNSKQVYIKIRMQNHPLTPI